MAALTDDRPSLFVVTNGIGSLFVYFDSPARIERVLRFPLSGGAGSVIVVVGPNRRPTAMQILNVWRVDGSTRELDIDDQQLKWELSERAVVLEQFGRDDAHAVQDTLADSVRLAQEWVQGRLRSASVCRMRATD